MSRYIVKTLGCKANLSDSQLIEQDLQKRGWSPQTHGQIGDGEVNLCIINSCTVTDEADRQTRKMAARLARENPNAKVVVTGCAAEVDPESLLKSTGIHAVIGNQNKNQIVDLIITSHILKHENPLPPQVLGTVTNYEKILSKHPLDREWPAATDSFLPPPTQLHGYSDKTRAFLKIQEGCNSFCTYCIIPYGRGPSRSLRPRKVIEQVRGLVQDGVKEIVITGTNIGDYGSEWGPEPALGDLLEMILSETEIERVRVSSLDPVEITPQIIELMKTNSRLCPHFHVSLQSPHSRVLRLMKRKYTYVEVEKCLQTISKIPGVFVGMDVITGFPDETDEEFEWTYKALESLPWSRLHVFPYSERKGTPATRLPNSVPQHIRVQRTKKLTQLSMERLTQHYRNVLSECTSTGKTLDTVLLEKGPNAHWSSGHTSNYLRVMIRNDSKHPLGRNLIVSVSPLELILDSKSGDVALLCQKVSI